MTMTTSATASATSGGSDVVHTGFAGQEGSGGEDGGEGEGNAAVMVGSAAGWAVLMGGLTLGFAVML